MKPGGRRRFGLAQRVGVRINMAVLKRQATAEVSEAACAAPSLSLWWGGLV